MSTDRTLPDRRTTYCVVCQCSHFPPVAVTVNDRCPVYGHTKDCEDARFIAHAGSGDDIDCICGGFDDSQNDRKA